MGDQTSKMMESGDVVKEKPKPQVQFSEEELRKRLTEEEYNVTQNGATERAWTGEYVKVDKEGTFRCVVCGTELFTSKDKFESGSGEWFITTYSTIEQLPAEDVDSTPNIDVCMT
jgi:peptide methionine sulfoxide reductase MsrB